MALYKLKLSRKLIVIAVVVLLIFLHYFGILSPIENLSRDFFSAIGSRFYSLATTIKIYFKQDAYGGIDLKKENEALQQQIDKLIYENSQLKILNQENKVLHEQLKLVNSINNNFVSCRVLSKQMFNDSAVLILNCGFDQGIEEGLPAVVSPGVIVGKIINVKKNISELLLITGSQSKLGAAILGDDRTVGLAVGDKDLSLIVEYIPNNIEIKIGEIIVTSSLEEHIPKNLIIGQVQSVTVESNNFFQKAIIKPTVDLDGVTIVTILLPLSL